MTLYRGAFHLHSRYSYDSEIEIKEMASLLKSQGFHFAFMSEHVYDRARKRYLSELEFNNFIEDCRRYSTPDFLLIPGLEFSCQDNKVHILVTPLPRPFTLEDSDTAEKILRIAQNEKALAVFVHPFWGEAYHLISQDEFGKFDGIEIWNYNYQGVRGPSLAQYLKLRRWFKQFPEKKAFAGLDLHRKKNVSPVSLEMDLKELTQENIFEKLNKKDYLVNAIERSFTSSGKIDNLAAHCLKRESDFFARLKRRLLRKS